jgi:hypothetical protein
MRQDHRWPVCLALALLITLLILHVSMPRVVLSSGENLSGGAVVQPRSGAKLAKDREKTQAGQLAEDRPPRLSVLADGEEESVDACDDLHDNYLPEILHEE